MANWCSIKFNVSGSTEDLARFREAVRGSNDCQETLFDFNRLIPMPPELGHVVNDSGTASDRYHGDAEYYGDVEAMLQYPWVKNFEIQTVEQLQQYLDQYLKNRSEAGQYKANIDKYGAPTWYEWCIEHWGTKWNACSAEITDNGDGRLHVRFDTAWSFPLPIFEKLVAEFPTLTFEGSAEEPDTDIFISFQGCNGELVWGEDDEAREAAAREFEEEDEDEDVTSEATT
jgi:Ferredoxin-like domain in Api92-like protein